MVSYFWNEIHVPQRMWKCQVHFLGPAQSGSGHVIAPCLSPRWFGVEIVQK